MVERILNLFGLCSLKRYHKLRASTGEIAFTAACMLSLWSFDDSDRIYLCDQLTTLAAKTLTTDELDQLTVDLLKTMGIEQCEFTPSSDEE